MSTSNRYIPSTAPPPQLESREGNRHERRKKEKLSRQLDKELRQHGVTNAADVEAIKRKAGLA